MAVRQFNGSTDVLNTATGALSAMTFGTFAVISRRAVTSTNLSLLVFHGSGGGASNQFFYRSNNVMALWTGGSTSLGPAAPATTDWALVVVRKATGTATPRFSIYNYTSTAWTHADASLAVGDWSAPSASGTVRFEFQGSERLNGVVAARAAWADALPWSADTSGDSALEAAGLEDAASSWLAASPDAMWLFNQASVATAVEDITENGADQSAITGTTVVTDDDPPGFSFELGGAEGPFAMLRPPVVVP